MHFAIAPDNRNDALDLPQPYLLFLGDVAHPAFAKTAFGLRDWARERCVGEYALADAQVSVGLPPMSPRQAHAAGARALVIGVANVGGVVPDSWLEPLAQALADGLDLIGGMHTRLSDVALLREQARRHGRRLIDVREPPPNLPTGTGRKRSGKRLLTVGTDCALGKKYTALALARSMRELDVDATFRASGQTGVLIAGRGVPLDAVVADFAAGAAELLSPNAAPEHWDVIEGQGSLSHPAYAGVSLALLHGSQTDVIVVCHEPGRDELLGYPGYALPSIEETIDLNLRLGRRTNPAIRCAGISLNTSQLGEAQARALIDSESARLGLPVADPIRGGASLQALVRACLNAPA
ncbi:DUF1611 domain-containing protein [Lysobacter sp. CA199]|uniref:DUF1611 domain-containing protein n=1 Tax=Lysobacter sp. CA199 TaxID=3455608 RepID=UPI003F8D5403